MSDIHPAEVVARCLGTFSFQRSFRIVAGMPIGLRRLAMDWSNTLDRGLAMLMRLAETQLWQRNAASLIRSGLFCRAETGEFHGLHTVVGVYGDGSLSAPLAKYADARRAQDAVDLVNQLSKSSLAVEAN